MKRSIFFLIVLFFSTSCDNPHLYEKYYGIYIDHFARNGSPFKDSTGTEYMCFFVPTVITNDSLVPAHVRLNFPKEIYHTNFSDSGKYKVFLMPDSMALIGKDDSDELKKFLDSEVENPFIVDTILKPKEACLVYIGFVRKSGRMDPGLSFFSRGHKPHFWPSKHNNRTDSLLAVPDCEINKFIVPTEKSLSLFLAVSILNPSSNEALKKYYNIIPCGQISYAN